MRSCTKTLVDFASVQKVGEKTLKTKRFRISDCNEAKYGVEVPPPPPPRLPAFSTWLSRSANPLSAHQKQGPDIFLYIPRWGFEKNKIYAMAVKISYEENNIVGGNDEMTDGG